MNTGRLLPVAVAALALLAGCTAGPSARPAIVVNEGGAGAPQSNESGQVPVPLGGEKNQ